MLTSATVIKKTNFYSVTFKMSKLLLTFKLQHGIQNMWQKSFCSPATLQKW